jgi:hypothetical protein
VTAPLARIARCHLTDVLGRIAGRGIGSPL